MAFETHISNHFHFLCQGSFNSVQLFIVWSFQCCILMKSFLGTILHSPRFLSTWIRVFFCNIQKCRICEFSLNRNQQYLLAWIFPGQYPGSMFSLMFLVYGRTHGHQRLRRTWRCTADVGWRLKLPGTCNIWKTICRKCRCLSRRNSVKRLMVRLTRNKWIAFFQILWFRVTVGVRPYEVLFGQMGWRCSVAASRKPCISGQLAVPTPEHYLSILYVLALKEEDAVANYFDDKPIAGYLPLYIVLN